MKPIIGLATGLAVGLMALLGAVGATQAQQMSISTGGTGGVYYPLGGGMANVFSKTIPGMTATAEVTGGSVDNMRLIGTGKPYIALTQADAAKDAVAGAIVGGWSSAHLPALCQRRQ